MAAEEPSPASTQGFNPDYFALLHEVEQRHFWFRARNRAIASVLRGLDLPKASRVVEVGCGTGNALSQIHSVFPSGILVGVDRFGEGLRFARTRVSCSLVQADMNALPFDSGFDAVCLLDVVEHLADDIDALRVARGLLAENGTLLLTVPAEPSLWSYFDEAAGHQRRYTAAELRARLEQAGFRVEYITHFMTALYPLVRFVRAGRKNRGRIAAEERDARTVREFRVVPVINACLEALLWPECAFLRRRRALPFGTSLLAVARRT